MGKDIVRLGGILCAITLFITIVLAGVNIMTRDIIAENSKKGEADACASLIEADFEEITEQFEFGEEDKITAVYKGVKGQEVVGYCVSLNQQGYGGAISMVVGIISDGSVAGIEVINHSETVGLGAKAAEEDFQNRFNGKKAPLSVIKAGNAKESEINAISGATITSGAVVTGVNSAVDFLKNNKLIGGA